MLKMKGMQMVSNHGWTLDLNEELYEFNGVKLQREGVFCLLGLMGGFGYFKLPF